MKRWFEISKDPNAVEVGVARRNALQGIRARHLIPNRVEYLADMARGRRVLDIGVVAHIDEAAAASGWLHGRLAAVATRCLGVDILEESVARLKERGYDVAVADFTQAPLAERFEVIVAGEVLEHLGNPGSFMKNCREMLEPHGSLFVTVPNPWYINVIAKNLRRGSLFVDSADHVVWYDPNAMYELGQRCGLELVAFAGITIDKPASLFARAFFSIAQPILIALGFAPELFAKSMMYRFAPIPGL